MVDDIPGDYVEFGVLGRQHPPHGPRGAVGRWTSAPLGVRLVRGPARARRPPGRAPGLAVGRSRPGGVEAFHAVCADHGIPGAAYTAVEGYYGDVLPGLGDGGAPTDIALAYLDCNMYSSTVTALRFLEPRLTHGMTLAFDDYYCWSSRDVSGERSAVLELQAAHPEWNLLRYKKVGWGGLSFVVERADSMRR